jgi:hypothetical protein
VEKAGNYYRNPLVSDIMRRGRRRENVVGVDLEDHPKSLWLKDRVDEQCGGASMWSWRS